MKVNFEPVLMKILELIKLWFYFLVELTFYANNDQQLQVWGSTRFPRLDNGDDDLYRCLSKTSTLRGSLLNMC